LIDRDFYGRSDTVDITSPDIRAAFYTTPAHNEIELVFSPANTHLAITSDSVIEGKLRRMIDYIYLNDSSGSIQSIRAEGNALFLSVSNPNAKTVTYLPDQKYPDSNIYEGPWIVNERHVGAFIWFDMPLSDVPLSRVTDGYPSSIPEIIPNPATHSISLDVYSLTSPIEAVLTNATGMILWEQSMDPDASHKIVIDMSTEASGTYFLHLTDRHTTLDRKFVLER
jgi:hypothetical protein